MWAYIWLFQKLVSYFDICTQTTLAYAHTHTYAHLYSQTWCLQQFKASCDLKKCNYILVFQSYTVWQMNQKFVEAWEGWMIQKNSQKINLHRAWVWFKLWVTLLKGLISVGNNVVSSLYFVFKKSNAPCYEVQRI